MLKSLQIYKFAMDSGISNIVEPVFNRAKQTFDAQRKQVYPMLFD